MGFLGGTVVKDLPAKAGDAGDSGLVSGLGRFPGGTQLGAKSAPKEFKRTK